MNQETRRLQMIDYLQKEQEESDRKPRPKSEMGQKTLLRELLNIRPAMEISDDFVETQNNYLQEELKQTNVTDLSDLTEIQPDTYLWQGDITTLKADSIVNAANSDMLGCFIPNHNCIDNIIHTNAGVQLRNKCKEIIDQQGHKEPVGKAKITPAYNLPSVYVIHTVGPYINKTPVSTMKQELLRSSYLESLKLADENNLDSIAFCCISTGVFNYPNDEAAELAIQTVQDYKAETGSQIKVIFNVFKDLDLDIYQKLLTTN